MAALKVKGLWDTDEEDAATGVRDKVLVKATFPAKSKPSLFDSDDGEEIFAPKLKTVPKVSKLFDDEDSDVNQIVAVDYRKLYESECAKRKELEELVRRLEQEIASLRALVPNKDDTTAPAPESEWDAMAREEKLRRQRAIQQKSSRHRSTVKRANGAPTAESTEAAERGPSPPTLSDNYVGDSTVGTAAVKPALVGHYLDSDEGGDDIFPHTTKTSSATSAALVGTTSVPSVRSVSLSPVNLSDDEETEVNEEILKVNQERGKEAAAREVPEDPDAVKWKELAAQEKARKALARRSVRVVRRGPTTANSNGSATGGEAVEGGAKPKHLLSAHIQNIKSSGSLQNLSAASATPFTNSNNSTSATNGTTSVSTSVSASALSTAPRTSPCPVQSDSDWDSHSSSEEEGKSQSASVQSNTHTYTSRPLPSVGNPVPSSRSVSPFPSSAAGSAANKSNSGSSAENEITPEEEAALDKRLRAWATGRSTAQLLCTVASVAQCAAATLLESGDVAAAAQALNNAISENSGQAAPGDVRKAYMRVIRICHPDKHMQLPPRSAAFLELQKIFTILSDSYNRFKAVQG